MTQPPPSTSQQENLAHVLEDRLEGLSLDRFNNFADPHQEWRRLASEIFGTFFLVAVTAGGGMVGHVFPGQVGNTAAVVAPGLMVMTMIMFMGRVSGAHFNPMVSIGFALRGEFPWRRVPGYVAAQGVGGLAAVLALQVLVHTSARWAMTLPGHHVSSWAAIGVEAMLTMGLISVILGTASGAQQVGMLGAVAVGAYIALAGLWASPLTGASMNPVRSFTPEFVSLHFASWFVYLAGPCIGMVLAVAMAWVLRGPGGDHTASLVAQGTLRADRAS